MNFRPREVKYCFQSYNTGKEVEPSSVSGSPACDVVNVFIKKSKSASLGSYQRKLRRLEVTVSGSVLEV